MRGGIPRVHENSDGGLPGQPLPEMLRSEVFPRFARKLAPGEIENAELRILALPDFEWVNFPT
jgi:hypothetical protein